MSTDFLILLGVNVVLIILVLYLVVSLSSVKNQLEGIDSFNQTLKQTLESMLRAIYEEQKNNANALEKSTDNIKSDVEIGILGLTKKVTPIYEAIDKAKNDLEKNLKSLETTNSKNKDEVIANMVELKKELDSKSNTQIKILKDLTSDFEGF